MQRIVMILVGVMGVLGCKGPTVSSPLTNEYRYTCCNLHYEKNEISDVNYQVGNLIPFGTRVQILEVRRNSVRFAPVGHPPITYEFKYGKEAQSFEQALDHLFVSTDPHAKLERVAAPARKGKGKGAAVTPTGDVRKAIDGGYVEPGMTKDQVLMALGYPPGHRTPSLDTSVWTYWQNRWHSFAVYFDGDAVVRVQR